MKIHCIPLGEGSNYNTPNTVIIHAIGEFIHYDGRILHAVDFLREIGLSAHALICTDGSVIQCRELNQGAYHAKGHNSHSIGIEFLVPGVHTYGSFIEAISKPYLTDAQFETGIELCRNWGAGREMQRHSDVDPARKKDPGEGFPWVKFITEVRG